MVAVLLGALAVGLTLTLTHRAPPRPLPVAATSASAHQESPPPPASAEELALLSPLVVGSTLGGFEVREIQGVHDGVLRMICGKGKAMVRLDIALVDDDGVTPPATAGKFAVFYSLRGALPEEGDLLARRLAGVLETHANAAPPRGMTKFQPREKPGVAL